MSRRFRPDARTTALRGARAACAAALLLIGGCSGAPAGPPGPTAGTGSGTIEWLAGPETETASDDVRQVLVDAFEQAHPGITVNLVTGPNSTDTLRSTLHRELSAGAVTPDVYSGDIVWPYQFARDKLALPLSNYLPRSFWRRFGAPGSSGTGATMVAAMRYRGAEYAVPYFVDEGFLYYRKDLLAKAGLAPPATWEQLVQDSKVLKQHGLPYQFVWQGNNYEGLTCDWYETMADAFGGLPAAGSPAAELDSPQSLRALDFLRSLITTGVSPRNTDTFEEPDADNAFDSGHAAFLRSWDSSYANALSSTSAIADPRKVGVEPPPAFQGQAGPGWSVLGGWSLFVNPHTRHLRADLTFVTWMASVQAQRILATQYQEIPTVASVRADPAIVAGSPVLQAAARTRLVSRPSATADYQRITSAVHGGVYSALPGTSLAGRDPCQALADAARQISPGVRGTLRCRAGG
jgi:multiple sugar transport system substrate-binding protein